MIRIIITLVLAIILATSISVWAISTPNAPEAPKQIETTITTPEQPEKPPETKPVEKLDPVKDNPNNCDLSKQYVWNDFSCHDKPSEPVAAVARSATTRGVEQWRSLVSQYDWDVETVLRIMTCESGGNSGAVGDTTTAYASYGLMQIRALPGRPAPSWLLIPENNISYAYQLSNGGANFNPWSCY